MKYRGRALVILGLTGISIWVIISALKWPPKTALFPLVIGIFVFLMAAIELFFTLLRRKESDGDKIEVMDFKFSQEVDQALAKRRTITMFLWILGFLFMILLFGFPITVPLCIFLYVKFEGKEGWGISLGLTAVIGIFFYFLFIWLLRTRFEEGWIFEGLKQVLKS